MSQPNTVGARLACSICGAQIVVVKPTTSSLTCCEGQLLADVKKGS